MIFGGTGSSMGTIFVIFISILMFVGFFCLFRTAFITDIIFVRVFFCKTVIPSGAGSNMCTIFVIFISILMFVRFFRLFRAAFIADIIFVRVFFFEAVVSGGTSSGMRAVFIVGISVNCVYVIPLPMQLQQASL